MKKWVVVAAVLAGVASVAACGGSKQDTASPPPAGPTATASVRAGLTATRAATALTAGGLKVGDLPGLQLFGAPLTSLDSPTLANLCATGASSALTSDELRLARRQSVWRAGPTSFVSEERIVYRKGGVQAALRDLRKASTTVCPNKLGVRVAPSTAKLPAGSLSVWLKNGNASMDTYVVPVDNQLLVVLWSNWNSTAEPSAIRTALTKARTVLVQREQPTRAALAG